MSIFNQNLKSPLEVKVEWRRTSSKPPLTLSISALMLNKDNVINKLEDFVFYGTPSNGNDIISSDKSITCDAINFKDGFGTESSYKMNLELSKVSESIDRINIVVSINAKGDSSILPAFDSLTKAIFSIKDAAGLTFIAELNKTGESLCRCITVGLVRRYGNSWRFEEEMELKLGGLELIYDEYMCDSIINNTPFNVIGDLSIIENKYKETIKQTTITKGGRKNVFERTVEVISTQIGKLTGASEPQKPWKGHRARHNPESIEVTNITSQEDNKNKRKPWKGKTKTTEIKSDMTGQFASRNKVQVQQTHKPWKNQNPKQKLDDDKTPSAPIQTSEPDTGGKRKFPKVKRPDMQSDSQGISASSSTPKRKFPKIKKKHNI